MFQVCSSIILKQCVASTSILASPILQCITLIIFINFHNFIRSFFLNEFYSKGDGLGYYQMDSNQQHFLKA
jgi:hypothetical protein